MAAVVSTRLGACKEMITRLFKHIYSNLNLHRNDFGIRCIIAPSFGEIFRNNTLQNGMLPIVLPKDVCRELAADARTGAELEVDLQKEEIHRPDGKPPVRFEIDPFRRHCLLNGLDDIGLTLQRSGAIEAFEERRSAVWPWLDGFGYKGNKIPLSPKAKSGTKTDW